MGTLLDDPDLFARLVGFDSTSANSNLPITDFLAGYLERPGVRLDRNLSADGQKANLIVRMGSDPGPDRTGLVLSAHMDTVPPGAGWSTDPFELTDRNNRWYGRGAADMKGFLALAVNAFARTDPASLQAPLALILTYDEELGLLGAERLRATWPQDDPFPKSCVVGEPTSLRVVRMHKGHMKLRVTLHGKNSHSGYPHQGVNAIEPAGGVLIALGTVRERFAQERPEHHQYFPECPYVGLNVGTIQGGVAVNIVPDRCTIDAGLRPLPGIDPKPIAEMIGGVVAEVLKGSAYHFEVVSDGPAMLLPEEAEICQALYKMTGQKETVGVSYGTDAGWFQKMGMECVVYGPGSIEVAHKPNEFMPKSEFRKAGNTVSRLIDSFCRS